MVGKKVRKEKKEYPRYARYKVDSGKVSRPPFCPRCGAGTIIAVNEKRKYCGDEMNFFLWQ